jgi:hypothetical protein
LNLMYHGATERIPSLPLCITNRRMASQQSDTPRVAPLSTSIRQRCVAVLG